LVDNFALLNSETEIHSKSSSPKTNVPNSSMETEEDKKQNTFGESERLRISMYQRALVNELLGPSVTPPPSPPSLRSSSSIGSFSPPRTSPPVRRLFNYKSSTTPPPSSALSLSPLSNTTQKLLMTPQQPIRNIPKHPFKVLELPNIQDDFYLNLLDWSDTNVLAVGLNRDVYLYHVATGQSDKLCSLDTANPTGFSDQVTSVLWLDTNGHHLAVGTHRGELLVWDLIQCQLIRKMNGHKGRIGALTVWSPHVSLISSGSRDRHILHRDLRTSQSYTASLLAHKQEVCGLKWSPSMQLLASGGNDNKLLLWDSRRLFCTQHKNQNVRESTTSCCTEATYSPLPLQRYTHHVAAVKAIAWSPHQRGLLLSGGGTADRTLKLWNTLHTSANDTNPILSVDTGSQVCNLVWCRYRNEIITTHGYSQNQIMLWAFPALQSPFAILTGHTQRVLYLALSPDNQTIATAAGDETLRFWNVSAKQGFVSFLLVVIIYICVIVSDSFFK
jgi:cell division cycle 20-like protein 1 (cofactor of APC complex)